MVSKAKAAEVEQNLKHKLEEAETEIQKRKEQMKLMAKLIAKGFQFPTKRTRICLTVSDFAKAIEQIKAITYGGGNFSVFSDPVDVAGFEWKLEAYSRTFYKKNVYGTFRDFAFRLHAFPPDGYEEGSFELEVDYSYLLIGDRPTHDIQGADEYVVTQGSDPTTIIHWSLQDNKEMMVFPGNFLQPDGSIQIELYFSVQSAKFSNDADVDEKEKHGQSSGKK